ncbi:MAG: methyltransferase, TIGR04325 family [Holosporaceae bacterium]|jgi:putative methyltransferase (TIGR04325 family)|nr:methyltransferase, TIGR04325 family [Holosporaceae bacterium]
MRKLAPVVLFAYNRLLHVQQTVESLRLNELANGSELFIFSDGGRNDEDWNKVKEVRRYLKTIFGFRKIEIFESEYNKGLANSVIDGVTKIVNEYRNIIVLEDDMVTSRYFLRYMNDALELYESDQDIACITGYVYPIKKLPETFFIRGADCWGWATWKKEWDLFEADGRKLLQEIQSKSLEKEFNFNNKYPYTQMLKDQISGKNSSWAVRWHASAFLKNKLCLYSGKSFVHNTGNDGSGIHCGKSDSLDIQLVSSYGEIKKIQVIENKKCRKAFENFLNGNSNKWSLIKKEKHGNRRNVTILGCIKFSYKKRIKEPIKSTEELPYGFSGDYSSWNDVKKLCGDYAQSNIFEATLASTLKVKNGEAVFERDSFIFDKIQYSRGLLVSLLKIAIENENSLSVLDFGGALGSHYFQNKEFLKPIKIKKWTVVEQKYYVKVGKEKISDGILDFAYSIDDVMGANVLIASGVIQYLDNPYEWLRKLIYKSVPYVIFDRTAFSVENRDRLTVQRVHPSIYDASYPAWFLDEQKFLDIVQSKYLVVADFDDYIDVISEIPSKFKGYLLKRKQSHV